MPAAPALGTMVDFPCEPLPIGGFAAPQPWVPVNADWLAFADWFDASPYADTRPVARAVFELVAFDGQLIAGVGDLEANPGSLFCPGLGGPCPWSDADGHGLPLYTFGPGDAASRWDHVVQEEVVLRLRRSGDGLLVPGNDPTEGDGRPACAAPGAEVPCPADVDRDHPRYELGHVHRALAGVWTASDGLATAWHVLDVARHGGVLFAAGSGIEPPDLNGSDATLWRSEDDGATWTVELALRDRPGFAHERFYLLAPAGDVLWAFGARFLSAGTPRNMSRRWDGTSWEAVPDFLAGFGMTAASEPFSDDATFVWGHWDGDGGPLRRRAAIVDRAGDRLVPFFDEGGPSPVDAHLVCDRDLLVLSVTDDGRWVVHRTGDLAVFDEVVSWTGGATFTALAVWDGSLVLGDSAGQLHRASPLRAPQAGRHHGRNGGR